MTTFITQARFTKEGLNGLITAPEDRAETVGRLIAQVGGKLIAYYLTSREYDILLIFEGASYEDAVPALIVAAAGKGVTDLKTVTALTSSEMKNAFAKAGPIAASFRSPETHATGLSAGEPRADLPSSESERGAESLPDDPEDAKAASAILDAEQKAVADIRAGRPAPYFLTPSESAVPATPRSSTKSPGAARRSKR